MRIIKGGKGGGEGTPPRKNRGGRPNKLTPELQDKITSAIRAGCYAETAASLVGLSKDTFYAWLKRGAREKKGKFAEFSDAIEKALAEGEFRDLAVIDQAANGRPARYLYKKVPDGRGGFKDGPELERDADGAPILVSPPTKAEWTAAAWRLERKFTKRWGRKETLVMTGDDEGGPMKHEVTVTPEERKARLDRLAQKLKDTDGEE